MGKFDRSTQPRNQNEEGIIPIMDTSEIAIQLEPEMNKIIDRLKQVEYKYNAVQPTKNDSLNLLMIRLYGIERSDEKGVIGRIKSYFEDPMAAGLKVKVYVDGLVDNVTSMRTIYKERDASNAEWIRELNELCIDCLNNYLELAAKYDDNAEKYREELTKYHEKLDQPFSEALTGGKYDEELEKYVLGNLTPERQTELGRLYDNCQTLEQFGKELQTNKSLKFSDKLFLRCINRVKRKFVGVPRNVVPLGNIEDETRKQESEGADDGQ